MTAPNTAAEAGYERAFALYRAGMPAAAREGGLRAVLAETLDNPGGLKRLQLALLAGRVTGLHPEAAEAIATAVEYFHTASLIFDDLPAMDDAVMRRGRTCVHRTHGEPAAMLGALALINRAYALIWRGLSWSPPQFRETAAANIEHCLGTSGVLDGQSLDLHFRTSDGSPRAVSSVAMGKTVSLLRLALLTPAILGGARRREQRLLDRVAVYWGLAYQLGDDFGDLEAGLPLGKTSGRDAARGRPNFVAAAGEAAARRRLERLQRLLADTISSLVAVRAEWRALVPLTHSIVAPPAEPSLAKDLCPV